MEVKKELDDAHIIKNSDRDAIRVSLAGRVADALLNDYVRMPGAMANGRLPSIRALVERYGVSRPIVGQALHLLEKRGVVTKLHGRGCFVRFSSDDSSKPATGRIGYVAPVVDSELSWRIYMGLRNVCGPAGFEILHASAHGDYVSERTQVLSLAQAECQAIVVVPVFRTDENLRDDYLNTNFTDKPLVMVGNAAPNLRRPQVMFDDYDAGRAMTRYLLSKGHRRIAFMTLEGDRPDWRFFPIEDRLRGYRDAMDEAGITPHNEDRWTIHHPPGLSSPSHLTDPHDRTSAAFTASILPYLSAWRASDPRATALIALEDNIAVYTIRICAQMGITIHDDLEIAGFDDTILGRTCDPPFVTASGDLVRAGEIAAEIALGEVRTRSGQLRSYVLPVPVHERSSAFSEEIRARLLADAGSVSPEKSPQ